MIENRTLIFEAPRGDRQLFSHVSAYLLDKETLDHLDKLFGEVTEAPMPEPITQAYYVDGRARLDLSLDLGSECFGTNRESVLREWTISRSYERVTVPCQTYGEGHVDAWRVDDSDEHGRVVESYVGFPE